MGKDDLNTIDTIKEILLPLLDEKEIELVDIEYKKEGNNSILKIFIDKKNGVTIDDCAAVSREFGTIMDVQEIINTSYRLEVSSPGLTRPLKKPEDYSRFKGRKVKIKTFAPVDETKLFIGQLDGFDNGIVYVDVEDVRHEIPFDMISKANLEIDF